MSLLPPSLRLTAALFVAATAGADSGAQQSGLPKNSPFLPPASAAAPTAAASETIEFAGVSSVGKRTDLIFYDKGAKKSHWIGIGETKEGIAVITYDQRREQATIKLNGTEKILALRKGTSPTNTPGAPAPAPAGFNVAQSGSHSGGAQTLVFAPPAAAPMAPAPVVDTPTPAAAKPAGPPIPAAQLKAETEARMLVSDLLEIGMAQRKAYEEAQRKAAEGGTTSAPAPIPPEPPKQP